MVSITDLTGGCENMQQVMQRVKDTETTLSALEVKTFENGFRVLESRADYAVIKEEDPLGWKRKDKYIWPYGDVCLTVGLPIHENRKY